MSRSSAIDELTPPLAERDDPVVVLIVDQREAPMPYVNASH